MVPKHELTGDSRTSEPAETVKRCKTAHASSVGVYSWRRLGGKMDMYKGSGLAVWCSIFLR
jgi:3-mercaptopyruvate sulfurtransferase SseA